MYIQAKYRNLMITNATQVMKCYGKAKKMKLEMEFLNIWVRGSLGKI